MLCLVTTCLGGNSAELVLIALELSVWELTACVCTALSPWEIVLPAWELAVWRKNFWLPGQQCLPMNYLTEGDCLPRDCMLVWVVTALSQVIFLCFLSSNLLNLLTCLTLILRNLSSLTLSMNCWHLSIIEVDTKDASFDLLNSLCLALSPKILLMDLTLA